MIGLYCCLSFAVTNAESYASTRTYAHLRQSYMLAVVVCRFDGQAATRDNFIGRMYNITRNSNLNYNNCDWANSTCSVSAHSMQLWRLDNGVVGCCCVARVLIILPYGFYHAAIC